ncbi:hypothetical protein Sjap_000452 [Stephania japonica]|uniref:Glutathione S-transferase n=1 Tax=Stephania japonica TaxID=461633 RepID=A0AAP0KKF5_9MAGN
MADEVTLLDFWASPFGMRVRLALSLKGVNYTYREEDLRNKSPLLLKSNPVHKKIPVLIHNANPISESLIIVQYIEDTWPTPSPLLPTDPYSRAKARFWADFVDKKVYDCGRRIWASKSEGDRDVAKSEFFECFHLLESELGERRFFGGEEMGFVDVVFLPFWTWFRVYEEFGGFRVGVEFPKVMEWVERCLEVEKVREAMVDPEKVYEFVVQMRRKCLADDTLHDVLLTITTEPTRKDIYSF